MAAVAGSKGRLNPKGFTGSSLQVEVATQLLEGTRTPQQAASALMASAQLREVGIDTNMICNLSCDYCYLKDRPEEKGSVPLDDLCRQLAIYAAADAKLFAFIGKEPLSDGRAVQLLHDLNLLRQRGRQFRTGMVTNGTLVTRWLDQLVDADLSYIDISIDGLTDQANHLRGTSLAVRIKEGVNAVVRSPLRDRFATATVLTEASLDSYSDFVSEMFEEGVVTCFASPVLRFAMSNEVSDYAVSLDRTWQLAERLAKGNAASCEGRQIILDLPYRYTWELLSSGRLPVGDVCEDAYEALYWQLPGSGVFLKLNPFPYSYWRALRITHDGKTILNMDLAAHTHYGDAAPDFRTVDADVFGRLRSFGQEFLADFVARHLAVAAGPAFERNLAEQYERHRRMAPAA